jgi:hypothetical protein
MAFLNNHHQRSYFRALRIRREKRERYGALVHPPFLGVLFFDRCLDIICCHEPDIWSHGTGDLLIAPPLKRVSSASMTRAARWRYKAKREHHFIREYRDIDDEVFGYFARRTIEYRDRMRMFKYEVEENNEILTHDDMETFEYIENMSHQLEEFSIQADLSRRAGIRRYGLSFDEDKNVTKGYTNYQIYDEIRESVFQPPVEALRGILFDVFPDLFVNIRELSFEDSPEESPTEDDLMESSQRHDITSKLMIELSLTCGECIVCYNEGDVLELPCHETHILCKQCISKVIIRGSLCPMCRKDIF